MAAMWGGIGATDILKSVRYLFAAGSLLIGLVVIAEFSAQTLNRQHVARIETSRFLGRRDHGAGCEAPTLRRA